MVVLTIAISLLVATSFIGCSNSNSTTPGVSYLGTGGPGDVWNWTIDRTGGKFSATNITKNFTYSGTLSVLSTGYLQLTLGSTTDPNATVGQVLFGLELPNTAVLLQQFSNAPGCCSGTGMAAPIIVAAAQGSCPTSGATYNFVEMPSANWNSSSSASYGTATSSVSGGQFSFLVSSSTLGGSATASSASGFTCTNGKLTSGSSALTFGVAPSGDFIADFGNSVASAPGAAGAVAPSAPITVSSLTSADYLGFAFLSAYADAGHPTPVPMTISVGAGPTKFGATGNANLINAGQVAPTTGTPSGQIAMTIGTQISPGLFNIQFSQTCSNNALDTQPGVIAVNQVSGKFVIFGVGVPVCTSGVPTTSTTLGQNFMLIQQ
jgi:hypothetical protein